MSGIDKRALKEALIDLLEEDRELRYTLMGLLGLREILDRITRLEERFAELEGRFARLEERQLRLEEEFKKLVERQQRLEERFARLEEEFKRLEERQLHLEEEFKRLVERQQRLEERFARLEAEFKRLEERFARLEERYQQLEERVARLEERQLRLEERVLAVEERLEDLARAVRELTAKVIALGHRYGLATEEALRSAPKYLVEDLLREYAVKRWTHYDSEGIVYGHPSIVEVDVLVRDGIHVLLEFKSFADRGDVAELYRIGVLYERVEGVKPRLLLAAAGYTARARELAERLGVELRGELVE